MADSGYPDQEWVDHFLPRAEAGDPTSQIAVAWEYVRGVVFEKNLDLAAEWFRKAEESAGELATYNLMKMYFIENDSRISQVFFEKPEWNYGVIYFLYGMYLIKNGEQKDGIQYLEIGAEKGNLICAIRLSRLKYKWPFRRLAALLREVRLSFEYGRIKVKDPDDPRVLA